VNSHRASFETRHLTANFLSEYTDLVVSHQWGLPLNYLYLEVCWLGYPLVHNAELCSDLGYYYRANDIDEAAQMILRAIKVHDSDHRQYLSMQRQRIARFLPTYADNIRQYDQLIDAVMNA
jgi:hypothetical protein